MNKVLNEKTQLLKKPSLDIISKLYETSVELWKKEDIKSALLTNSLIVKSQLSKLSNLPTLPTLPKLSKIKDKNDEWLNIMIDCKLFYYQDVDIKYNCFTNKNKVNKTKNVAELIEFIINYTYINNRTNINYDKTTWWDLTNINKKKYIENKLNDKLNNNKPKLKHKTSL